FRSLDATVHPFAVADIPLLFEVARESDFDLVIVAACDPETQVRRVMARDRLSEPEARQRLAAQLPIGDKVRRADFVIRTDGSYRISADRGRTRPRRSDPRSGEPDAHRAAVRSALPRSPGE